MDSAFLQTVRYKLQKRVRRLNAAGADQFLYALRRFWVFFDDAPILGDVGQSLRAKYPAASESVEKIVKRQHIVGETEEESAAIGEGVLRNFASQEEPDAFWYYGGLVGRASDRDDALRLFREEYLTPFHDYVDENLDDQNFILFALARYKHVCEWFERSRLYAVWQEKSERGEKALAMDLYRYLFEKGIEFNIEPWSASGEADMVAAQSSEPRLVAETKIFNPESGKGKSYLLQAFHQTYAYTCDYNQSSGYIVIFNTSDTQLRFAVYASNETFGRVLLNNKTLFFLQIDIYPHTEPASRRKPSKVLEISEQEIAGGTDAAK